jgi:hypothetical protein
MKNIVEKSQKGKKGKMRRGEVRGMENNKNRKGQEGFLSIWIGKAKAQRHGSAEIHFLSKNLKKQRNGVSSQHTCSASVLMVTR